MGSLRKGYVSCDTFRLLPEKRNSGDTWVPKQFKNIPSYFYPSNVWTDGANIYHSDRNYPNDHRVLVDDTWEVKTWKGFTDVDGTFVWTDGINIYYSYAEVQYVLNGDIWEQKVWVNGEHVYGNNIWTYDNKIYYSSNGLHYILNGDTWESTKWSISPFSVSNLWSDGQYVYCSNSNGHYVFNGEEWEVKTWGTPAGYGAGIWSDGESIYYSTTGPGTSDRQLVLNGDVWVEKIWKGVAEFYSFLLWSDGINIYLQGLNDEQYVLTTVSEPTPIEPTSMLMGWLTGERVKAMLRSKREPVAYLYSGVRLPKLPEWDMETYPYAYLVGILGGYRLTCTDLPLYQARFSDAPDLSHPISAGHEAQYIQYLMWLSDDWSFDTSGSKVNPETNDIEWANTDVTYCNTDTKLTTFTVTDEVFLAASDPIPIYE